MVADRANVYLEEGKKRVFASAADWPGWCRSGKGVDAALEALTTYIPRYSVVTTEAGVPFEATSQTEFEIVERLSGNATTDFGAPGAIAASEFGSVGFEEAERISRLVAASWSVFDGVVAGTPAELRKGPRGGGRDRDKMVDHVLGSEASYARTIGVRHPAPSRDDTGAIAALRAAILDAIRNQPPVVGKGWPVRYAARRIAWHVLDHAWEMEDRSTE